MKSLLTARVKKDAVSVGDTNLAEIYELLRCY